MGGLTLMLLLVKNELKMYHPSQGIKLEDLELSIIQLLDNVDHFIELTLAHARLDGVKALLFQVFGNFVRVFQHVYLVREALRVTVLNQHFLFVSDLTLLLVRVAVAFEAREIFALSSVVKSCFVVFLQLFVLFDKVV